MSNNFPQQSRHGLLKSPIKCSVSLNLVKIQLSPELENVPLCLTVTLPEGAFTTHDAYRRPGPRVHTTSRVAIQLLEGWILFLVISCHFLPWLQPQLGHSGEVWIRLAGGFEGGRGQARLAAVCGWESGAAQALKSLKLLYRGDKEEK